MGNEGVEKCAELSGIQCSGDSVDYNLCLAHPKAHFVWFAVTHFAQFLSKLEHAFTTGTISVGFAKSDLVKKFYVSRKEPSELIFPVSIFNGIAAALSAAFPPAAVAAGGGTIIAGALTQAALDKPE